MDKNNNKKKMHDIRDYIDIVNKDNNGRDINDNNDDDNKKKQTPIFATFDDSDDMEDFFNDLEKLLLTPSLPTRKKQLLNPTPIDQDLTKSKRGNLVEVTREVMKPSDMVKELDKVVIGHAEAKKHLAVVMFKHLTERKNVNKLKHMGKTMTKSNVLISGLSGSGKTYMVEQLCKILGLDYILIDCASLTAPGYIGGNIDEEIGRLFDVCEGDSDRINNAVVILDEIGKLRSSENSGSSKVDVGGEACTKALLKILEGSQVKVGSGFSKRYIDTENILFIGTDTFMMGGGTNGNIEEIVRERIDKKGKNRAIGFFGESEFEEELTHNRSEIRKNITLDDIIKFGFSAELVSRFSAVINLEVLTKEDYVKIAKLERNGFSEYETLFELYGKKLVVKDDIYEALAEYMMNCATNSRALKGIVDRVMIPFVYGMMDDHRKKKYVITKEMVEECIKNTPTASRVEEG